MVSLSSPFRGCAAGAPVEAQPEQVSSLHRRASAWYEQNGYPPDAIRHALAAEDFKRAAGLIEMAWSAMDISSTPPPGWAGRSRCRTTIWARPVLSVGYAWALLDGGELEACEARFRDAERWLEAPSEQMVVVDKELFRSLPAPIATARAYRSLALGDIPGTIKYAQQALELAPEDDQVRHNEATSLLGLAQYTSGDLEAAERSLADFYRSLRKTGEILTLIGITFLLADIRVALGRLQEAESSYQLTLRLVTGQGSPCPSERQTCTSAWVSFTLSGATWKPPRNTCKQPELGEQTATTDWPYRLCISRHA